MSDALLAGRTAVVTGGANGIGAAVVRVLADAGVARGAVLDLRPALVDAAVPDGWTAVDVDLRDAGHTAAAFATVKDALGAIDVLVAAAGVVPLWTGVETLDLADWDDVIDVNARGVLCSMREALPAMPDDGAIVVIASQNAWRGSRVLPAYAASKHAVLGLVRSAALELGPRGIRVNAVGPGSVATDAYRSRLARRQDEGGPSVDDALARDAGFTALRRLATEDEVANGVLFLASRLASGVTGHILPVGAWVT
jgi:NAD(P)-dependent dehydrogenase (short-subunit alcohol dehydrogenase family)